MSPSIQELEDFFKGRELPKTMHINRSTKITDVTRMVDSHFATIKSKGMTTTYSGFYTRLVELKELLEAQQC